MQLESSVFWGQPHGLWKKQQPRPQKNWLMAKTDHWQECFSLRCGAMHSGCLFSTFWAKVKTPASSGFQHICVFLWRRRLSLMWGPSHQHWNTSTTSTNTTSELDFRGSGEVGLAGPPAVRIPSEQTSSSAAPCTNLPSPCRRPTDWLTYIQPECKCHLNGSWGDNIYMTNTDSRRSSLCKWAAEQRRLCGFSVARCDRKSWCVLSRTEQRVNTARQLCAQVNGSGLKLKRPSSVCGVNSLQWSWSLALRLTSFTQLVL